MLEFLAQQPAMAVAIAAVFGLLVGSFLNVVVHRLPIMMQREWEAHAAEIQGLPAPGHEPFDLIRPRSRCPHCGHAIGALENIPVISWLALRGRCKGCGNAISARYPIVELITGVLAAAAIWFYGPTVAGAGALFLTFVLIALTGIDLDTQLLPDSLTLPLLWVGLFLNLWAVYVPLNEAVVGAIAGYLTLWSVYWLFKLVTGKEGMGYGDFKLLAALGAWFGWQSLPAIILLSSVVAAVIGLGMIVFARHGRQVPIAFGPYLAGAGLLTLYFGEMLRGLYLP
ncbi:MAG: A24 family peptidase [Burkholderiaceae bacterium]